MTNDTALSEDVFLEVDLPHTPDKVWRAIADADLVGQWLEARGLRPEVGCRFRLSPAEGTADAPPVECEVVEAVPGRKLEWRQREHDGDDHAVESFVTLELMSTTRGTRLRIVHDRFREVTAATTIVALSDARRARRARVSSIVCLRRAA